MLIAHFPPPAAQAQVAGMYPALVIHIAAKRGKYFLCLLPQSSCHNKLWTLHASHQTQEWSNLESTLLLSRYWEDIEPLTWATAGCGRGVWPAIIIKPDPVCGVIVSSQLLPTCHMLEQQTTCDHDQPWGQLGQLIESSPRRLSFLSVAWHGVMSQDSADCSPHN